MSDPIEVYKQELVRIIDGASATLVEMMMSGRVRTMEHYNNLHGQYSMAQKFLRAIDVAYDRITRDPEDTPRKRTR